MVLKDQQDAINKHNKDIMSKPYVPPKKVWSVEEKQEYLKTDTWNTLRKLVLERDGYTCQCCGRDFGVMHVHHLTYERLGKEWFDDLTTLCPECHKHQHETYGYSYQTDYRPLVKRK